MSSDAPARFERFKRMVIVEICSSSDSRTMRAEPGELVASRGCSCNRSLFDDFKKTPYSSRYSLNLKPLGFLNCQSSVLTIWSSQTFLAACTHIRARTAHTQCYLRPSGSSGTFPSDTSSEKWSPPGSSFQLGNPGTVCPLSAPVSLSTYPGRTGRSPRQGCCLGSSAPLDIHFHSLKLTLSGSSIRSRMLMSGDDAGKGKRERGRERWVDRGVIEGFVLSCSRTIQTRSMSRCCG